MESGKLMVFIDTLAAFIGPDRLISIDESTYAIFSIVVAVTFFRCSENVLY